MAQEEAWRAQEAGAEKDATREHAVAGAAPRMQAAPELPCVPENFRLEKELPF